MSLTQHWKLNDNAASTSCVATTGNNGTYARNSSNTYSGSSGPGTAIFWSQAFNGTSDLVDISGASLSFASGSAFSMSCFVKWGASTGVLVGKNASAISFIYKSSDTAIQVKGSSTTRTYTVPSLGTTNWHHVLVTRDTSNNTRVFVDGAESSTGTQALAETFAPDRIGNGLTFFLGGSITWVKVFNSDESANVATLYAERNALAAIMAVIGDD